MMNKITISRFFNLFFFATAVMLLSSCANNDEIQTEIQVEENTAEIIYQQILETTDYETKKVIAESMTDQEKVDFWSHHIDVLLATNTYTAKQIEFFAETKEFGYQLIDDINTGRIPQPQVCQVVEGYFENTPEDVFLQSDLHLMFTMAAFETTNYLAPNAAGERVVPFCNCRLNRHCTPVMTSCTWAIACTRTNTGCGTWLFCHCTGRCI